MGANVDFSPRADLYHIQFPTVGLQILSSIIHLLGVSILAFLFFSQSQDGRLYFFSRDQANRTAQILGRTYPRRFMGILIYRWCSYPRRRPGTECSCVLLGDFQLHCLLCNIKSLDISIPRREDSHCMEPQPSLGTISLPDICRMSDIRVSLRRRWGFHDHRKSRFLSRRWVLRYRPETSGIGHITRVRLVYQRAVYVTLPVAIVQSYFQKYESSPGRHANSVGSCRRPDHFMYQHPRADADERSSARMVMPCELWC